MANDFVRSTNVRLDTQLGKRVFARRSRTRLIASFRAIFNKAGQSSTPNMLVVDVSLNFGAR